MSPKPVFRGLSNKSWINKQTNPESVSPTAFLRKPKDMDGISVFDDPESCSVLRIFGIAEIQIQDVVALNNPLNGTNLKVCYNRADNPHHLVIDNVPFQHEHPDESETLALHMAMKATIRD